MVVNPVPGMAKIDVNTNPYFPTQAEVGVGQLKDRIAIEAKVFQAQSQFGPVGAAAVAISAHRNVGSVQYG